MIVDKINAYLTANNEKESGEIDIREALPIQNEIEKLSGFNFKRQFVEANQSEYKLRLSDSGKCPRQIAYKLHKFENSGKKIDSRARVVFWMGDNVEAMIVGLAKLAGVQLLGTGLNQIGCALNITTPNEGEGTTTHRIEGHPDGIVSTDKGLCLLEVKSMSSFAFMKFQKNEIDDGYRAQINSYLKGLKLEWCVLVGVNKDSGVLHEMFVQFDSELDKEIDANLRSVIDSTPKELPNRKYAANEKGKLPWQCVYCAHWGDCWPNAEIKVERNANQLYIKGEK